ncbi:MAG: tryptophan--tRNA ligase [archaeon]
MTVNPFTSELPEDYEKTMKEFGISPITPALKKRLPDHHFIRRGIIFGHRDLERILDARDKKKPFAILTGIKPSGPYHLGNKLVIDQLVYFQNMGAKVYFAVADVETYHVSGKSIKESERDAIDNVADLLALGLREDNYYYRQSAELDVLLLGHLYSKNVTYNMLKAIYGEHPMGHYDSALIQVGDILYPQMPKFNGPKPVIVPVGLDQDPHMRLTRDIAGKQGLIPPSSTYNKMMRSLTGNAKMSKSEPNGIITLNEDEKSARKKVMNCFTGGRATIEEQKKLGGQPEICVNYEMFTYLFEPDDAKLKERFDACRAGTLLCGECKKECADRLVAFLREHQEKKKKTIPKAKKILRL